jgi:3-oxoacyl-[acyl-carrier protein] reductase
MEGFAAIVTGAGTGLGRAMCVAFAAEGADVAVAYNSSRGGADETVAQVEAQGRKAIALQCDLTAVDSVRKMIKDAYKTFGRVDVLVNNGAVRNPGRLLDYPVADWDELMDGNLRGMFFAIQEVTPIMEKQGFGKIINVSSVMGSRPGQLMRAAYTTSKRGIMQLTQSAAKELGPKGIYVNCLVPGSFTSYNVSDSKDKIANQVVEERRRLSISLGRRAAPDEIKGPAVFLACHESDYVDGVSLVVDGGWSCGE